MFLEIIAITLTDIDNINKTKANQIELCTSMEFGGYTPDYQLIAQACINSKIPVMVMVRHSNDGFNINDQEFMKIKRDIEFIKTTTHAHGIVCGILTKNNSVDIKRMTEIIKLAKPLKVTFHRAFDEVISQTVVLEQLVELGITTVLTSGGKNEIDKNINNFKKLKNLNLPIKILTGGGVNMENLPLFLKNGINDIHVGKCVRKNDSFNYPIDPKLINKILAMEK